MTTMSVKIFLLMSVMVFFHGCKSETTGKDVFEETAPETVFDVPSYLRREYGVAKALLEKNHGPATQEEKHKDETTGLEVWQINYLTRPGNTTARVAVMFQSFAGNESPVFMAVVAAEKGFDLEFLLKFANLTMDSESYNLEVIENKGIFRYWLQVLVPPGF